MKNRLNITVDPVLIEQAKRYADKHHMSLSQMVEMYFKSIVRPSHKKNIIDLLNELPRPKAKLEKTDLEKRYLESRKRNMASKAFVDASMLLTLSYTALRHKNHKVIFLFSWFVSSESGLPFLLSDIFLFVSPERVRPLCASNILRLAPSE